MSRVTNKQYLDAIDKLNRRLFGKKFKKRCAKYAKNLELGKNELPEILEWLPESHPFVIRYKHRLLIKQRNGK